MKMNQTMNLKSVNIRGGKTYNLVEGRIAVLIQSYPRCSIVTEIIGDPTERVIMKAKVTPDTEKPERYFVGHSQAKWEGNINSNAALENAETSAIGRALAAMGLGGGASYDEMVKCGAIKNEELIVVSGEKEDPKQDSKIVKMEIPAENLTSADSIQKVEAFLIANKDISSSDLVEFLADQGRQFDSADVQGDWVRLPEKMIKELASKVDKLAKAVRAWKKKRIENV
jgi:hypothetical protein